MWGDFLGKRRHCLPLITWVKGTLCTSAGLRVQGTDRQTVQGGEQAGAGSQALTLLLGRRSGRAVGTAWGQEAQGLLTFPGKASELRTRSCWLLGSD